MEKLFIIMMMAIATIDCSSNMNCVIDAFDHEKQEFAQKKIEELKLTIQQKTQEKAQEDNSPKYMGDGLFKRFVKVVKHVVGIVDPAIEPIAYSTLNAQYLKKNKEFLAIPERKWIHQQCIAYVDSQYKSLPRSDFICTKLVTQKKSMFDVMVPLQNVAHLSIGNILRMAAKISNSEKSIESKGDSFATTQGEFAYAETFVNNYYDDLWETFENELEERYTQFFAEDKEELYHAKNDLEYSINALLDTNKAGKAKALDAIWFGLKNYEFYWCPASAQKVKNVINDFKEVLIENPSSEAYTILIDIMRQQVSGKAGNIALMDNVILPYCLSKLLEFPSINDGSILDKCKKTINKIKELKWDPVDFSVLSLHTPSMKKFLLTLIGETAVKINEQKNKNFLELPVLVANSWEIEMKKTIVFYNKNSALLKVSGVDNQWQIPLLLSFKDILENPSVTSKTVLTKKLFIDFNLAISNTVFDSNKVFNFIEESRTNTIKELGKVGKEIKLAEFRSKLTSLCRQNKNIDSLEICEKTVQRTNFKDFLHYRYQDHIFKLLMDRFILKIGEVVVGKSNKETLISKSVDIMVNQMHGFDYEYKIFVQDYAEFAKLHGERRVMQYLLVAKSVFSDPNALLPHDIHPYIENWGNNNFEHLKDLKLRAIEFSSLMDSLQGEISYKMAEDNSIKMKLKRDEIIETDSNQSKFGLTALEKKQIKLNLSQILTTFDQFPSSLKTKLSECVLPVEEMDILMRNCGLKNGHPCERINAFLVGKPCSAGFQSDKSGNCLASCPDNFPIEGASLCRKPAVEIVEARDAEKGLGCRSGFQQEGILCVAKCPSGWKDFGEACERPNERFNIINVILLVE